MAGGEVITFIILLALFIYGFITSEIFRNFIYIILAIFAVCLFYIFFIKKYDEYERGIVFRMGKFNRIVGPGWSVVVPFFEKEYARIDVRTNMMNLVVPAAFTRDDLQIKLTGFIYYRVDNPRKAVLKIQNYITGLKNLIVSETRNEIGSLTMRELFSDIDKLNDMLADRIRHSAWRWGIYIPMVQIESVTPSSEIIEAMQAKSIEKEMLQAQVFKSEARKIAIEAYGEAANKLDDRSLMYLYIKALEKLGEGKSTKIIFPSRFFTTAEEVSKNLGRSLNVNIDDAIDVFKKTIAGGNGNK